MKISLFKKFSFFALLLIGSAALQLSAMDNNDNRENTQNHQQEAQKRDVDQLIQDMDSLRNNLTSRRSVIMERFFTSTAISLDMCFMSGIPLQNLIKIKKKKINKKRKTKKLLKQKLHK